MTTEPNHLSVRDEDDREVLEDGVNGDREELEGFRAGVDDRDEEEGYGEPGFSVVVVEISD